MWSVWGVFVLFLVALKVYISRLNRDEDDQLVLDDAFNHIKSEQAVIMARIHRIEPFVRGAMVLVTGASLFVVGYYFLEMKAQLGL
jgi:hypothetical protein